MPIPAIIHCRSPAVIFPLLPKLSPVLNRAGQDVGDGFDAAMWMPGKSGRVIVGVIVTEIVQQEKWIEFPGLAEADGDARAFTNSTSSVIVISSPTTSFKGRIPDQPVVFAVDLGHTRSGRTSVAPSIFHRRLEVL